MSEKSHVSLERKVCVVCGAAYDTGAILLDRRLRKSLERHTCTGSGLCPEHQRLYNDGFVALVECDPEKSGNLAVGAVLEPAQAYRTGRIAHLKRETFGRVFNVPIGSERPYVFVEPGVIDTLQSMTHQ
jgi:hypothetical protein